MIPRSVDGIFPSWFKVYNSPSTIEGLRFTFYNAKLANEEASFLGKDASFCHSCVSRSPENADKTAGFPLSRE